MSGASVVLSSAPPALRPGFISACSGPAVQVSFSAQRADPGTGIAKAHAPPAGSEVMGKVGDGVWLAGTWCWSQRSEGMGPREVTGHGRVTFDLRLDARLWTCTTPFVLMTPISRMRKRAR